MSYQKDMQVDENVSNWKGCCAQGCPVPPSASLGGNQYCLFHQGSEYADFDSITAAVKHNLRHYEYYRKVITWGNEQWKHGVETLRRYEFCQIEPHEEVIPQPYINRLFNTIIAQIKIDARNGVR